MNHVGTSPWRTPANLAATRDLRLHALNRARRGPRLLGVDIKLLIFLLPHTCVPLSLCYIGTPLKRVLTEGLHLGASGPPSSTVPALALVVLLLAAFAAYFRVYNSDPGCISFSQEGTPSPHGACRFCSVQPTLRSRHDRWTGQCVHKLDHYCWFLSTSVGDANHCPFWGLLLVETMLTCWLLLDVATIAYPCLSAAALQAPPPAACLRLTPGQAVLLAVLALVSTATAYFFTHLLALHTYLALTNQTTIELLKGVGIPYLYPYYLAHRGPLSYPVLTPTDLLKLFVHELSGTGPPRPFSQGPAANLRVFFWAKKPHDYQYQQPFPRVGGDAGDSAGRKVQDELQCFMDGNLV